MKKILIIRLSSIGDIVLTSPVIRCLKQQVPGAVIHFAVKTQFVPVISANPYIDRIHEFKGDLRDFIRELKAEKFDLIIDLHKNFRSLAIRWKTGVKSRSFPKINFRKWLIVRLKIDKLPRVHIVDRYFAAVRDLHVSNDGKGLDYFIPEEEEVDIRELPSFYHEGYFALAIGARHQTKKMPLDRMIELCEGLSMPVILLGGAEDRELGEEIVRASVGQVLNGCGAYSLNGSASLVKQSISVITHDTGIMHIAAALRKKIISVWGNTIPEFGMSPYLPEAPLHSVIMEVKGLSCRPCSKLGFEKCPKGHFRCMNDQDVGEMIRIARMSWEDRSGA